jgi:hypothetical protein
MRRVSGRIAAMVVFGALSSVSGTTVLAQSTTAPKRPAATARDVKRATGPRDSAAIDAAERAALAADEQFFLTRLNGQRRQLLKRAGWAALGERCNPGALRVFPRDTTPEQRASLQSDVEAMEQTIVGRGVGARLDTPDAQLLLRIIVGWEAGIDRPLWDSDEAKARVAVAAGLTGETPDPRGPGCLPSPIMADTVTFVVPGFSTMEFPQAPKPRVKAYFGPQAQAHARDEFFAVRGSKDPESELSYIVVAPMVIWREWALVGVDRPREKAGIAIRSGSNGGAAYLMHRVGRQWRLLAVVRSWGS